MPVLKLPSNYVDPATQTPLPDAVGDPLDVVVSLRAGIVRVQLGIFASAAAEAALAEPVVESTLTLSPGEIQSLVTQFKASVLSLIAQRPEFAGSSVV